MYRIYSTIMRTFYPYFKVGKTGCALYTSAHYTHKKKKGKNQEIRKIHVPMPINKYGIAYPGTTNKFNASSSSVYQSLSSHYTLNLCVVT